MPPVQLSSPSFDGPIGLNVSDAVLAQRLAKGNVSAPATAPAPPPRATPPPPPPGAPPPPPPLRRRGHGRGRRPRRDRPHAAGAAGSQPRRRAPPVALPLRAQRLPVRSEERR